MTYNLPNQALFLVRNFIFVSVVSKSVTSFTFFDIPSLNLFKILLATSESPSPAAVFAKFSRLSPSKADTCAESIVNFGITSVLLKIILTRPFIPYI